MNSRWILEGEWSGYTSAQRRIVHRTVYAPSLRKFREWAEKTHALYFTDGTALYLTVRDCKPRERVQEIRGYDRLIGDCQAFGVVRVADLPELRRQKAEQL